MNRIFDYDAGVQINYGGGRLADVYIDGAPVECVQVRDYDFATGEFGPEPTDVQIKQAVTEFINEAGGIELYRDNA